MPPEQISIPDLTFPPIEQGTNETPFSLARLLYKGGATLRTDQAASALRNGALGSALPERIDLVTRAHEAIAGKLAAGGSQATAKTQIKNLTAFFGWAETSGHPLSLKSVQAAYIHWTDNLLHRQNVLKDMTQQSVYTRGRVVGQVLDQALGRPTPMIELTRLREPKRKKSVQGIKADKQNLEATFAFGRLLQDICDGLPLDVIWGPRPVHVPLREGNELVIRVGMPAKARPTVERTPYQERTRLAKEARRRAAFENDKSIDTRATLVNLRILAELLMFIGQTGMNLAQANELKTRHFSYASDIDGYKVRDYKARRGGEVLFEIFKEYRGHFERYLEWRRTLFPNDDRLFPLLRTQGAHVRSRPYFGLVQQACKDARVAWQPPSVLRSTRVNWLLRRSGSPDLTAEMAQHHKQTLLRSYEVPSQQRAIGEITRFWQAADPAFSNSVPVESVAPGACDGVPVALPFKPKNATAPDCLHPSGCLWCAHHRDIDSFDYVWALGCFRHLKTLEVSRYHPPVGATSDEHPGHWAIARLSEKLGWFRESNAARRAWVEEALLRVQEGSYHPEWSRLIDDLEGIAA